jgi:Fic family protein
MLERAQKGGLDVTDWLLWFLGCFVRAITAAEEAGAHLLRKADFWSRYVHEPLSQRQKSVISHCIGGIEGRITTKWWAVIGECSVPTAQRDINDLLDHGILRRNSGGSRKASYRLNHLEEIQF